MRTFGATVIVKHPPSAIAKVMRDQLPALAPFVPDIDKIERLRREKLANGSVRLVHLWKADIDLPSALQRRIGGDIVWTDNGVWTADGLTCAWSIKPHILDGTISCSGQTAYSPALGQRGTRVTFNGVVDIRQTKSTANPLSTDKLIAGAIELVLTSTVPKNLRRVVDAASGLLDKSATNRG